MLDIVVEQLLDVRGVEAAPHLRGGLRDNIRCDLDIVCVSGAVRHVAHDLGAELFFFWGGTKLPAVPFGEILTLSRHLEWHAERHPRRDRDRLARAAEVLILFPAGYNLGHVYLGKGILWGLGELNLEELRDLVKKHPELLKEHGWTKERWEKFLERAEAYNRDLKKLDPKTGGDSIGQTSKLKGTGPRRVDGGDPGTNPTPVGQPQPPLEFRDIYQQLTRPREAVPPKK